MAAVYLGLGKIMLNGCECIRSRTEGGTTTTTTLKVGYISRECLAFVYRLVCEMRRIPRAKCLGGLSEVAKYAVLRCEAGYSDWFPADYHTSDGLEQLERSLQGQIATVKERLAELEFSSRKVENLLVRVRSTLHDSHHALREADAALAGLSAPIANPHLRYLSRISAREAVSELSHRGSSAIEALNIDWGQMEQFAKGHCSAGQDSGFLIARCPIDDTRLRLPTGRGKLLATCPLCKYKFMVKTSVKEMRSTGVFSKVATIFRR